MRLIKKFGLYIFAVLLFLDCFLDVYNLNSFRIYTTSILIPILTLYYYTNNKRCKKRTTYLSVYVILLFAYLSDLFTLINKDVFEKPSDFIVKLILLLLIISAALYGILFGRMQKLRLKKCPEAFIVSLLTIPSAFIIYKFLNVVPIGGYKYPIILSMIVMILVIAFAANIFQDKAKKSIAYENFIPGSISLAISLAIMLVYQFLLKDVDFLPGVVTLTYGFGHMLMIRGFTRYLKT